MGYVLLADLIALLHLAILAFVVIGQLLILVGYLRGWSWTRNFWFRIIHVVTIAVVVYEAVMVIQCPLTVWEGRLRLLGGQEPSQYSFTARVVHFFIFWGGKNFDDPNLVWSYYVFGALVLLSFVLAPPRSPWRKKAVEDLEQPEGNRVTPATE